MSSPTAQLDPKLLEILRCPVAVHYTDKGDDPGKLTVQREYWLVCEDSDYKYPIIDGIPKMLIEEGAKWKDTPVDDLPVPPPNDPVYSSAEEALTPEMQALAASLAETADHSRSDAAKALRETAQQVRQQATSADSPTEAVQQKAEAIAKGLEQAADVVDGEAPATPPTTPSTAGGVNWMLVALLFALGLIVGLLLRGGNRD